MESPALPEDEELRLEALRREALLSTPSEPDIDLVTRLAAEFFDVPIALFSLSDVNRQWFKSRQGLGDTEMPRSISFCGHAILQDDVFVIENAVDDSRFRDNPLVTGEPLIVFYAGKPIRSRDGFKIGTLCLIDHKPRAFDLDSQSRLEDFAHLLELVLMGRKISDAQSELITELTAAKREALIDPMTQVWNRRGFDQLAGREIARARRHEHGIAAAMIDIDHFKKINDRFGHAVGDIVIYRLAEILRKTTRRDDVLARVGGEEFAILMPNVSAAALPEIGAKFMKAIRDGRFIPSIRDEFFSVSIGLAYLSPDKLGLDGEAVLALADQVLYKAKNAGRNQFQIFTPD